MRFVFNILKNMVLFLKKFDFDINENGRNLRVITIVFVGVLFSISFLFVGKTFKLAEKKESLDG